MATKKELVASDLAVEEIRQYVGATSLAYLSLANLVRATGQPAERFCRACFDGIYPVPVPEDLAEPKLVLESGELTRPS
jgi:amidophosphoribosyltransferase